MPRISRSTLQRRYGGKWVALSKGKGKVYASHERFSGLMVALKKQNVDLAKKVILSKVDKPGTVNVYQA